MPALDQKERYRRQAGLCYEIAARMSGKQKTLALGAYPIVSLADARDARDAARKLLARGVDPSVQRKIDRQIQQANSESSFRAVAEEVISKLEREGRVTILMKRWLIDFAFPAFGERPVAVITARELLALLRQIESRGLYETAKRLRSTCGMVFRFAIATGRAERDPSANLRGGGEDEDAAASSGTSGTTVAGHSAPAAGNHWTVQVAVPVGSHHPTADLRKHIEWGAAAPRIWFGSHEHARFPRHVGDPAQ
jgi:hypothetical protein